jgi:hypothetical protein
MLESSLNVMKETWKKKTETKKEKNKYMKYWNELKTNQMVT